MNGDNSKEDRDELARELLTPEEQVKMLLKGYENDKPANDALAAERVWRRMRRKRAFSPRTTVWVGAAAAVFVACIPLFYLLQTDGDFFSSRREKSGIVNDATLAMEINVVDETGNNIPLPTTELRLLVGHVLVFRMSTSLDRFAVLTLARNGQRRETKGDVLFLRGGDPVYVHSGVEMYGYKVEPSDHEIEVCLFTSSDAQNALRLANDPAPVDPNATHALCRKLK